MRWTANHLQISPRRTFKPDETPGTDAGVLWIDPFEHDGDVVPGIDDNCAAATEGAAVRVVVLELNETRRIIKQPINVFLRIQDQSP